ncbi:MAG: IPT/TIG domain-containing protein, partial [Candidatus Sulfotelmatobacter sp.]
VPGYTQQPLIQITSPANNSLFTEGTTITITVSADPSVQVVGVIPPYPLPEIVGTSTPNQFTLTIPTTAPIPPGIYNLAAIGDNASGDVESAPVAVDVEWPYYPMSITAYPPLVNFSVVGNQMPIRIMGTLSNYPNSGTTTLDITNSTQMVYTSNNPQVATVSSTGVITAVGSGQTAILAQAGAYGAGTVPISAAVWVQVPQQPPSGPSPVVTSVSPTSGAPGTTQVTITGTGFGSSEGNGFVQIGTLNGVVSSWTNTQIVATVPSGSQNGVVEVDQGGLYSNSIPFTISSPVIQSMSASAWSPGMQVTLTGSGFGTTYTGDGQGVYLGGNWPSIVSWSDTQIVFTVPTGIGPGSVLVLQNHINSNTLNYTMIPPVLASISPTAWSPGMQVTLTGSGFGATGSQEGGGVYLGGVWPAIVSWSDTQIVFTVPTGIGSGSVLVEQNYTNSNTLSYTMIPPVLSGVSPTAWSPGMQVTLTGSGFGATGSQEGAGVYLGGVWPAIVSWSDTQIVFTVPTGIGPGSVLVEQNYTNSNTLNYTMIPAVLSNVSPTTWTAGMQVTLTGSGFGASQGNGAVYFCCYGIYAAIVGWSDTQIVFTVPSGLPSGEVLVLQNGVNSNEISYTSQ